MVVECILEMVMGILELEEEEDKLVVGGGVFGLPFRISATWVVLELFIFAPWCC
jgi:hypothetical protein